VEGFKGLAVYQHAGTLADRLHHSVSAWPAFDRWTLGVQLVRAADSIGANVAEADGRYGSADQRRLLFIGRGPACELQYWLERAATRRLRCPGGALEEAAELTRMLNGLARRLPN
jgi:four helix bundle protein